MKIYDYFRTVLQAPPAEAPIPVTPPPETPEPGKPAEVEQAIVVTPNPQTAENGQKGSAPAAPGAPVVVRPKTANAACLQLPEYPEGSSYFHKVSSIEEYKILLELGTRSTWATKFSESDYLLMEKWLGMDKFRPKTPNRVCEATEPTPAEPNANPADAGGSGSTQESNQVQPVTDTIPVVVVPAEPKPSRVPSPRDRTPRGTYY